MIDFKEIYGRDHLISKIKTKNKLKKPLKSGFEKHIMDYTNVGIILERHGKIMSSTVQNITQIMNF